MSDQILQIPLAQAELRRMSDEPITDDELRRVARSHVGNDPERIERMVQSYRAGTRLRHELDGYAVAGVEGGLRGMEAHIKRQSDARRGRRSC